MTSTELVTLVTGSVTRDSVRDNGETRETTQWRPAELSLVVLQKVPSEANPKVRNHGEGPY